MFPLLGLPREVVTTVISFLSSPRDLSNCIIASKVLATHVAEAELCLDLGTKYSNVGSVEETALKTRTLAGLRKYYPSVAVLLLPNVPLEDADLQPLLAALPRLQLLDVSGGRKLTHASASVLARANSLLLSRSQQLHQQLSWNAGPAAGPYSKPQASGNHAYYKSTNADSSSNTSITQGVGRQLPLLAVNMQRCFQLHAGSLDALLKGPRGLAVLALSHLDLGRWPTAPPPPAGDSDRNTANTSSITTTNHHMPEPGVGGRLVDSLQVLALHNCLRLHGDAISALAAHLDSARGPGSGVRFLLLGGSLLSLSAFVGEAAAAALPPIPPAAKALLLESYRPRLSSTAATREAHLAAAQHLVAAALALPRLAALELSFMPPPLVQCVRAVLADEAVTGRSPVEVWDFAVDVSGLQRAQRALQAALGRASGTAVLDARSSSRCSSSGGGGGWQWRGGELLAAHAATAVVRAAVTCSSAARSTPLHMAAERGDLAGVQALLAAGAGVDVRDTGGTTPLFLAAEAGHTAVVRAVLAGGADPRVSNAAGESPLYIASLRGHLAAVVALLEGFAARGLTWLDPDLYGDCWTPLMAAAVANHTEVAQCLLQAAGASGSLRCVSAVNKYGQSVMHIAARNGSGPLLSLLLSAGGGALVGRRDDKGDTPVDVARKNRHVAALEAFRRVVPVGGQGGGGRKQQMDAWAAA